MANRSLTARFADACLRPASSIQSWASGLCNAAEPIFARGGGEGAGMVFSSSRKNASVGVGLIAVAGNVGSESLGRMYDRPVDQAFESAGKEFQPAFRSFRISFVSELFKRTTMRGFEPWERFFPPNRYVDQIGIDASIDGYAVFTTLVKECGWATERSRDLRTLRRLLTRSVPARLRSLSDANADAVIAPDGQILHAPAGLGTDAAKMLSRAVQAIERARVDARAEEEGERLWNELLAGQWSLVEHIDSDGKRIMLLGRSPSPGSRLTASEAALLKRVEQIGSIKQIAAELDVSTAAASERISTALTKLGFPSRAEYLRFCRSRINHT